MSPSLFGPLMEVVVTLLPLFVVVFLAKIALRMTDKFLRKPEVKGWMGEKSVVLSLRRLDSEIYRVFHDLYLPRPDGKGTTQVDHVVVSKFGVFVIETKNYGGCIFGSESEPRWMQVFGHKKHTFQNPVHQNNLHISALQKFLDLNRDCFHSVIYFKGNCTFRTPRPECIILRGLLRHVLTHRELMLEQTEVLRIQTALTVLVESTNRASVAKAHRLNLREIHSEAA